MELQGKVIAALPERSGTSARGDWKSQEFVIEYQEGQYPRHLVFTVFGADRLQRFNIQVGQNVLVAFDIDAHEWNGRWFTDIRAFDVRQVDAVEIGFRQADGLNEVAVARRGDAVGELEPRDGGALWPKGEKGVLALPDGDYAPGCGVPPKAEDLVRAGAPDVGDIGYGAA